MTNPAVNQATLNKVSSLKCEEICFTMIATSSTIPAQEVVAILSQRGPNATLAHIGYTTKTSREELRRKINTNLRIPAGKPPFPPEHLTAAKKVASVISETCN